MKWPKQNMHNIVYTHMLPPTPIKRGEHHPTKDWTDTQVTLSAPPKSKQTSNSRIRKSRCTMEANWGFLGKVSTFKNKLIDLFCIAMEMAIISKNLL